MALSVYRMLCLEGVEKIFLYLLPISRNMDAESVVCDALS